jgi:predicted transcriptional regulator
MTKKSLSELREEMRGVARGERQASALPAGALLGILSSQGNLDLLRVINQAQPSSVSELAQLVGRVQPNVSRALQQLAKHGLVRLERDGKEVRPVAVAQTIDIDLTTGTYRLPHAA